MTPRELGQRGEFCAIEYLKSHGFRIVARNVTLPIGRTRQGNPLTVELDIVALDGDQLVFVEVKTRLSENLASPLAAVTPHKQTYLRRGARRYRHLIGPFAASYRFDVVGIVWPPDTEPKITHVRDFFR